MKREAIYHPKICLLAKDLSLPMCFARGIMESLWLVAGINFPRGDIGRWTDEEIAAAIDYPGDPSALINSLTARRLLDKVTDGRLYIHDWHEHADSYIHAQLARSGKYFLDGSRPRIPHERFDAFTRKRIEAEYNSMEGVTPGELPENSRRTPGEDPGEVTRKRKQRDQGLHQVEPECTASRTEGKEEAEKKNQLSAHAFSEFELTTTAVCSRFPSADVVLVSRIVENCARAYLGVDKPKIPEPTDAVYAEAVAVAASESKKQNSAALFLKTVPAVIENWARRGRNGASQGPPRRTIADMREEREKRRRENGYAE